MSVSMFRYRHKLSTQGQAVLNTKRPNPTDPSYNNNNYYNNYYTRNHTMIEQECPFSVRSVTPTLCSVYRQGVRYKHTHASDGALMLMDDSLTHFLEQYCQ